MRMDAPSDSNKEYRKLLAQLYAKNDNTLYQQLMAKEKDVLDVVNRVANDARMADIKAGQFVHLPLAAMMQRFYAVILEVGADLAKAKMFKDIVSAVRRDDHVIYIGILLVITALFLLLLQGD